MKMLPILTVLLLLYFLHFRCKYLIEMLYLRMHLAIPTDLFRHERVKYNLLQ